MTKKLFLLLAVFGLFGMCFSEDKSDSYRYFSTMADEYAGDLKQTDYYRQCARVIDPNHSFKKSMDLECLLKTALEQVCYDCEFLGRDKGDCFVREIIDPSAPFVVNNFLVDYEKALKDESEQLFAKETCLTEEEISKAVAEKGAIFEYIEDKRNSSFHYKDAVSIRHAINSRNSKLLKMFKCEAGYKKFSPNEEERLKFSYEER